MPNATIDQEIKLQSLEQQKRELTATSKEQQVNQVYQSNSQPTNADNTVKTKSDKILPKLLEKWTHPHVLQN